MELIQGIQLVIDDDGVNYVNQSRLAFVRPRKESLENCRTLMCAATWARGKAATLVIGQSDRTTLE